MTLTYIKIALAIFGVFFGAYLMALAFSTQLTSPAMNNIVIVIGFLISGGSLLYLLIKIIGKLNR